MQAKVKNASISMALYWYFIQIQFTNSMCEWKKGEWMFLKVQYALMAAQVIEQLSMGMLREFQTEQKSRWGKWQFPFAQKFVIIS